MAGWWPLLFYLVLSRCRSGGVAGQVLPSAQCGEDEWDFAARLAFQYFAQHVRPKWTALTGERNLSAVVEKSNAEFVRTLINSKQQCFVEFIYRYKRNKIRIGRWYKVGASGLCAQRGQHPPPQAHGSCDNVKSRAEILYVIINYLITQTTLGARGFTHDFRFWYDLTDSTVVSEHTASFLSFPILSFGAFAGKACLCNCAVLCMRGTVLCTVLQCVDITQGGHWTFTLPCPHQNCT